MVRTQVNHRGLRTWLEIDTAAIKHNLNLFRRAAPTGVKLLGVVKSNAYGHGLIGFSRLLADWGIDWLGVDSVVEAIALRRAGIKTPVLVFGYTLPENFSRAARLGITLTISSLESLKALLAARGARPAIQLKVDTGMHRQGFGREDFAAALKLIKGRPVRVVGLYSHLAAASTQRLSDFTHEQEKEFIFFRAALGAERRGPMLYHLAASGGIISNELDGEYNLIRLGLGMYGLWTTPELCRRRGAHWPLCPVLVWKTIIGEVKRLPVGGGIGYGLTKKLPPGAVVAICPIGYWHGYPCALSNHSSVAIRGQLAPVVGRVSMDMLIIDVSRLGKVEVGDEVELIGPHVSAETLALQARTSPHEIITRLNPLIEKFYFQNKNPVRQK
ncbi:MAG: alanine racemase [Patescibacteria group bacterium]